MGEEVEKNAHAVLLMPIENCLGWHQNTWAPLQQQLEDLGFRWEKFLAEQPRSLG